MHGHIVGRVMLCALVLTLGNARPGTARVDFSPLLTFEGTNASRLLGDWSGRPSGPNSTLFLDSTVVHQGRYAGRIERTDKSASDFSSFAIEIPIDFAGDSLELRGWLKLEQVATWAGLWQRQDTRTETVGFDNMKDRPLKGTADWREYSVRLPLHPEARTVNIGALVVGPGRLWLDDLSLYVDGRPIATMPEVVPALTVLETDHEFDGGSKIDLAEATPARTENLALLGMVWGYLKYHHPAAATGQRHWDYELFRVMPRVLEAGDRAEAQKVLADWVAELGAVPPCNPCAELPPGRPVTPPLAWLSDQSMLGKDLSARLLAVHGARPVRAEQFYVGTLGDVGNANFGTELAYEQMVDPDAGFRLLALFRYWNIIEYWFPNRDIIGEDWAQVLPEFVPRLIAAHTRDEYQLAMLSLIARVNDTHANLWSSPEIVPPRGRGRLPVVVRFVENQAVVAGYWNSRLGPATGLKIGDAIIELDGVAVSDLIEQWRPWSAASNEPTRLRDIARRLTRGEPGPLRLKILRGDHRLDLDVARVPADSLNPRLGLTHDYPGPACRRLSDDLVYLTLSSVKAAEVPDYLAIAAGAKCLLIDIRNYPSEFMVFKLGNHFVKEPTPFATFTKADIAHPGSFQWSLPESLVPEPPYLEGAVVILVDEMTQSSAEYTTMALRARPGAVVVGSTTAGADGNVSHVPLPGGLRTMISGIGVFYPDRRPTQRVGIVPDLVVLPTIAGIRAGQDEVLEAAVRRMLGREMTPEERSALSGSGN